MAIVKCENGHFYNDSESNSCPYCTGSAVIGATIPLDNVNIPQGFPEPSPAFGGTEPLNPVFAPVADVPKTTPVNAGDSSTPDDPGRTVIIDNEKNSDVKPVRGWLVVIAGKKLGMDFKICNGVNTIGRDKSNNIHFDFDPTVTGKNACSIAYDDKSNLFYIAMGASSNLVRLNTTPVLSTVQLKDNDIVEIGETKLVFRSLCNESFNYNMDGDASEK